MKRFITSILLAGMVLMGLAGCNANPAGETSTESTSVEVPEEPTTMKAAMCKVDITPDSDVYLTGYVAIGDENPGNLANYPGDFLTDIMARILILEVNGERILQLNTETTYIGFGVTTSEGFQQKLATAAGVDAENIFLSNTHNHQSSPWLDEAQESAIITAAEQAARNLVPVKLGVDTYGTEYGISRSPVYAQNFEVPYDNTVTILRFDDAESGVPIGMVYCAAIHNTAFGVCSTDNWDLLNCEFTGFASRYLEEQFAENADFTAMHITGFIGNAGPYFPEVNRWYSLSIKELKRFGESFGEEILDYFNTIVCEEAGDMEVKVNREIHTLRKADPLTEGIKEKWGESENAEVMLNTFSVGDIAFMEINAEPFATIGAHLRAEAPFEYLIASSYINTITRVGYIPLKETYLNAEEAEIQSVKTPFDKTGEEQFLKSALDTLCALKGVTYERTLTTRTSAEEADSKRIYTFEFAEEIAPDKLVLSFDQSSRMNCAKNFVLEVFDKEGNKTRTIEVRDNSVNYLGFSVEGVKAAKVILTVSSTYRSGRAADISVSLHAMNYTPIE